MAAPVPVTEPGEQDLRHVVSGKIERNDPERRLGDEMDVYIRYNWALDILLGRPGPLRVLELGAGLGWFARVLADARPDATYVGLDLELDAVNEASRRYADVPGVRFVVGDVCRIDESGLETGSFDAIVWFQNIEHVNPTSFVDLVASVERLLAPGGSLLVETPNRIGGGGLNASGPMRLRRGQHNPHHFLELTLEETRYLFPGASIRGYEIASTLPRPVRALARAAGRMLSRVGLFRVRERIDHGGAFTANRLAAELVLSRFPLLNRCFLVHRRL